MPDPPATRRARGRWHVETFTSIDSTNRYVLDEARAGAREGLVAVADHQTAGRGRLGRVWQAAPRSSLLVSVLVRPALPAEALGTVTMAAGLALAEAVTAVTGLAPALKWPNDLVIGDRKLAGLLAEADLAAGRVRVVVVGAGCNLTREAVPPELAASATSCELECGHVVDRDVLLDAFLDRLGYRLDDLPSVLPGVRARSATLGRRVRVDVGDGRCVEGRAEALDDAGGLVVRDDVGTDVLVAVGDVVHLRGATEPGRGGAEAG